MLPIVYSLWPIPYCLLPISTYCPCQAHAMGPGPGPWAPHGPHGPHGLGPSVAPPGPLRGPGPPGHHAVRLLLEQRAMRTSVDSIAYCLLPIAYSLLPIAYCLLPIAHCLLHMPGWMLAGRGAGGGGAPQRGPGPGGEPPRAGRRMHPAAECIRRPNAFRGSMHSEAVCNQGRMQSSPNAIN